MEEKPEALFAGRYRILGPLGAGGMGVVYAARDERLGRDVALKVLKASALGSDEAQARLVREARAAAALEHPGIVRVYDVSTDERGTLYMVMERVRGESVGAVLARGELSVARVLELLAELARALGAAHRAGFVHRDVKPENVMVREDGSVVLLDLGLARSIAPAEGASKLTTEGALVGTPAYIAPEQAQGQPVSAAADQFSLAVMAFELLCGALPWSSSSTVGYLASMLTEPPLRASSVNPALPLAVDEPFARALDKDPRARFATIEELPAALAEALHATRSLPTPGRAAELEPTLVASTPSPLAEPPTREAAPPEQGAARAPRGRRVLLAAALGAALLGGGVPLGLRVERARAAASRDRERRASPLVLGRGVLACPLLAVRGAEEPSGWFGAAAGSIVCARAQWLLGGRAERVLSPAELLALPARVSDRYPEDPYDQPDARARSLSAARARASVYADGSVTQRADGVTVELLLRHADGSEWLRASATHGVLRFAVAAAVDALAERAVPAPRRLDPEVARWTGLRSVEEALTVDTDRALLRLTDYSVCPWVLAHPAGFRTDLLDRGGHCGAPWLFRGTPPEVDRSSPELLARTATQRAIAVDPGALRPLGEELHAAMLREGSVLGRAALAHAEGAVATALEDFPRARSLLLAATRAAPRDELYWDDLLDATNATTQALDDINAFNAWFPDEDYGWFRRANLRPEAELPRALQEYRRAYLLAPGDTPTSVYAFALMRARRWSELRALAAEHAARPTSVGATSEWILATVDAGEGRLGAALQRSREGLRSGLRERTFAETDGDSSAATLALNLALLLGREREVADELVHLVLDPEPPRLRPESGYVSGKLARVCFHASPELARPCIERVRALEAQRFFLYRSPLDSAFTELVAARLAGDAAGALAAARTVVRLGRYRFSAEVLRILDEAREYDLADSVDQELRTREGDWNGANLSYVRSARRALLRGDRAAAVRYARAIVDAWQDADVAVPAVAELRALLAPAR